MRFSEPVRESKRRWWYRFVLSNKFTLVYVFMCVHDARGGGEGCKTRNVSGRSLNLICIM